jgi:N-acetylglucosaminyl-diphospho-decaprenol L-rhamnosyltransferase
MRTEGRQMKGPSVSACQGEHVPEGGSAPESGEAACEPGTRVSVVIVTYRNAADIGACLRAVDQSAPGIQMEVIVVDNASGDGTVAAAAEVSPGARIVELAENGGFAIGCRGGAAVANGNWLLFLTPDAVIAPDAIKSVLDCARRYPSAGIVGGRFVHESGTVDPRSWWGKPSPWSVLCFAAGLSSLFPGSRRFDPESAQPWTSDPEQERPVPVVSGALMLVERKLWDALDGFDPQFFMYAEDADFCMRAAAIGYRPMVTARAECCHEGGKSSTSARKLQLLFTGKATLIRRHFPPGLRGPGIAMLLVGVFVRASVGRFVSFVTPARQGRPMARGEDWQELWDTRRQWRGGWARAISRKR